MLSIQLPNLEGCQNSKLPDLSITDPSTDVQAQVKPWYFYLKRLQAIGTLLAAGTGFALPLHGLVGLAVLSKSQSSQA